MSDKHHTFDTNQAGQIIRPSLHDGWVSGVVVGEGEARLLFEDVEKRHFTLRLGRLDKLLASDFREGNIILDVVVRPCQPDDGNLLARLSGLRSADREADFLATWLERSISAGALIVEVNPSYGCSILALCNEIEMTADDW